MASSPHISVLLEEACQGLALSDGDFAVDCTVGAGGHTAQLLGAVGPKGHVLGLDRDTRALEIATKKLAPWAKSGHLILQHGPFSAIDQFVSQAGQRGQVAGVLADIGVSSMHLDEADRGFSFQHDGPLDMRMDQQNGRSAKDLIAYGSEEELTRIFREFGEEPKARQIARKIVLTRDETPITTTIQLANLVKIAAAYKTPSKKHPATRVFQALRIAVNDELRELELMLKDAFSVLKPGGRLAVITFHSLEDRVVKNFMVDQTGRRERAAIPRDLPLKESDVQSLHKARGDIIKPFPITPSEREQALNPRARSAKLRIIAKI